MAAPTPVPGDVLDGKWRIDARLGEGGMGTVFAATHVRNGRRAAIKVLRSELARDPELCERLRREGYAANRIGHPGVAAVLDDGVTTSGVPFLVMELLVGVPLDRLAEDRGGRLQLAEVLDLGTRWLEVVAAAHALGVVHRDLKPENLFVTESGAIKILDFGIAHIGDGAHLPRLTATGVPMGTPAFMPPEQALARWGEVDARSDVFALGASLFTLLTGRLVHEAPTAPEHLVMASTRQVPPVRTTEPAIPATIAAVLDRSLAFRAADRFRDAGEMLAALRAAAAQLPRDAGAAIGGGPSQRGAVAASLEAGTISPLSTAHRPGRSTRGATAAGVAALVATFVISSAMLLSSLRDAQPAAPASDEGRAGAADQDVTVRISGSPPAATLSATAITPVERALASVAPPTSSPPVGPMSPRRGPAAPAPSSRPKASGGDPLEWK